MNKSVVIFFPLCYYLSSYVYSPEGKGLEIIFYKNKEKIISLLRFCCTPHAILNS